MNKITFIIIIVLALIVVGSAFWTGFVPQTENLQGNATSSSNAAAQ